MNDDLIQKMLDEGGELQSGENSEIENYKNLFRYLDEAESFSPAPGFAHRVAASIDLQEKQRSYGILIPLIAGALLFVVIGIGVVAYAGIQIDLSGSTNMLIIMFSIAVLLTGAYRFVEKRILHT